jgi:hypothetical protein
MKCHITLGDNAWQPLAASQNADSTFEGLACEGNATKKSMIYSVKGSVVTDKDHYRPQHMSRSAMSGLITYRLTKSYRSAAVDARRRRLVSA